MDSISMDTRETNVALWNGLAADYDAYRPQPPAALLDILTQLAHAPRPRLVVDLGSGTGLSTRAWAGRAGDVVGVEPNDDMQLQAEARGTDGVRYVKGYSTATGLPDGSADIVTCSQSLHWMEPEPTFAEVARILRPGGIFAAYDHDWPPIVDCDAEQAFVAFMQRAGIHILTGTTGGWDKAGHLERIEASGRFRYVREILVHSVEMGDAERFIGLAMSNGITQVLGRGLQTAESIGLDRFEAEVRAALGDEPRPWYFSYRVRLGQI
jgi:ubiquinone/menaquinone biosynthesis C-methylase UbiE